MLLLTSVLVFTLRVFFAPIVCDGIELVSVTKYSPDGTPITQTGPSWSDSNVVESLAFVEYT